MEKEFDEDKIREFRKKQYANIHGNYYVNMEDKESQEIDKRMLELEKENEELKNKCEHLTKIITYIMEREDICYIDDGEYGLQIAE